MNEDLKRFNYCKTDLFGHYANIEMEFYGEEGNQKHIFKVISQKRTNFYNDVPFNGCTKPAYLHKEIEEVVGVIHCGIMEEDVYYVPLKDIEILPTELEDKIKAKIEEYKKQLEKMEKDDVGIGFTLGKEWSNLKAKVEFGQSLLEKE